MGKEVGGTRDSVRQTIRVEGQAMVVGFTSAQDGVALLVANLPDAMPPKGKINPFDIHR